MSDDVDVFCSRNQKRVRPSAIQCEKDDRTQYVPCETLTDIFLKNGFEREKAEREIEARSVLGVATSPWETTNT